MFVLISLDETILSLYLYIRTKQPGGAFDGDKTTSFFVIQPEIPVKLTAYGIVTRLGGSRLIRDRESLMGILSEEVKEEKNAHLISVHS